MKLVGRLALKLNPDKFDFYFDLVIPKCYLVSSEVYEARAWAQSKLDECKQF